MIDSLFGPNHINILSCAQVFYTFSSFFLVAHTPLVSDGAAFGLKLLLSFWMQDFDSLFLFKNPAFWIHDFDSLFIVDFPLQESTPPSPGILLFGFISIILNYATDRQKERFKARSDAIDECHLFTQTGDKRRVHHLGKKGQVRSGH